MWTMSSRFATGLRVASLLLLSLAGGGGPVASTETGHAASESATTEKTAVTTPWGSGTAIAARRQAAEQGKYLFAFFWKTEDDSTTTMRELFGRTMAKVADRADAVAVNVTDPAERAVVDEYDLDRAPMPLVLAIAPNGAITGGFPNEFSEQDLLSAFATPATEQCMRLLQEGKLVFLCVQNEQTGMNAGAMRGVNNFAADERFREVTEIVSLDPSDETERPFLRDLQIDPATETAATVFLAPPGAPIAMFEGATTKEQLLAELQEAGSCGPGGVCGPGGCAPQ